MINKIKRIAISLGHSIGDDDALKVLSAYNLLCDEFVCNDILIENLIEAGVTKGFNNIKNLEVI